jgi:hypothetical protein
VSATACPCGEVHELSARVRAAYEAVTGGLPADAKIEIEGRVWSVPKIYIAVHGLKAGELPALAEKYGWAPAP